jgi:hypothetical protein
VRYLERLFTMDSMFMVQRRLCGWLLLQLTLPSGQIEKMLFGKERSSKQAEMKKDAKEHKWGDNKSKIR